MNDSPSLRVGEICGHSTCVHPEPEDQAAQVFFAPGSLALSKPRGGPFIAVGVINPTRASFYRDDWEPRSINLPEVANLRSVKSPGG